MCGLMYVEQVRNKICYLRFGFKITRSCLLVNCKHYACAKVKIAMSVECVRLSHRKDGIKNEVIRDMLGVIFF